MRTEVIQVPTGSTETVHDITGECRKFLRDAGATDGLLNVFVPHATAGIALIEMGSGSDTDLLDAMGSLLPKDDRWTHSHGSRGHGRSHVMPAMIAPYATIPVVGGKLALGTWQSVAVVDLNVDNVERKVRLSFIDGG
jgi:secondary thiamine-phosphate synthase enzyme